MHDKLVNAGALLLDRHFVYGNGHHGPDYFCSDALLDHAVLLEEIAAAMTRPFVGQCVTAVMGPSGKLNELLVGACINWLGAVVGRESLGRGERVLIVNNDVVGGGTIIDLVQVAQGQGATVVGAAVVCNLGDATATKLGVPQLVSLVNHPLTTYTSELCPLCRDKVPIVA